MKLLTPIFSSLVVAPTLLMAANAYHNQIGFLTNGQKQLALTEAASAKEVVFKDADGKEVLKVDVPAAEVWKPAGEAASLIDFSELKTAGTYQAFVDGEAVGHPIVIGDKALENVAKASLKFFYFQRASTELPKEYAGEYARAMGHPDTAVYYHISTGIDDAGRHFNGAKGWYDAGDYGKYIVNSGISTYTLLQLYQHNKAYFDTLKLNIPESKNEVPDLLDEIRWNLEWMLTMQDEDGGVFHKLTTKAFAGMVMPEKATSRRYAIGKSTTASYNFTAVLALASEIYAKYDAEFAKKCAEAAEKAYNWSLANPRMYYSQPRDVGTGTYTDGSAWDEAFWASVEMYRISKNEALLKEMDKFKIMKSRWALQAWPTSNALGAFTIATNPDIFTEETVDSSKALILGLSDSYLADLKGNGYGVAMGSGDFYWGSNSIAANKGMMLLHAYILTKEEKYLNAATGILDYLLGRNPLDLSYVTGYGVNRVMHPHHRPSEADGIEEPIPGMVAGGPNASADDCAKSFVAGKAPAKSYYDNSCSYATNEVAINWNAPLAYLAGSIQAIAATGKVYDTKSAPGKSYEITGIMKAPQVKYSPSEGFRRVIRDNKVQIERVGRDGSVHFFDLKGHKIN